MAKAPQFHPTFHEMPLARLVLPFIAGILPVTLGATGNLFLLIKISAILWALVLLLHLSKIYSTYRFRWIFGILVHVSLFINGYTLALSKNDRLSEDHFSSSENKSEWMLVEVNQSVLENDKSYKSFLSCVAIQEGKDWKYRKGNVLVYFNKTLQSERLRFGDVLLIRANKIQEVPAPANPGEFNYRSYLNDRSIYHRVSLSDVDYTSIELGQGNALIEFSFHLRDKLLYIFSSQFITGEQYAVLSALILGYKEDIETELYNSYSAAGAVHILAVSGLHVGIIYLVLNWLLGFMDANVLGRVFKTTFLLGFLWFYALLTGLSPAVLRASTMLSIVVIAFSVKRKHSIYNTLAGSLLFLLTVNPYFIKDVGFQLSYLAVLGIVMINPVLDNLWKPRYGLLKFAWTLITISIAAQLSTLPLTLFYFQQFPTWFLISNLFIIPLSTLIVYEGILLFLLSSVPFINFLLAFSLNAHVWLLNFIVKWVEALPYSVLRGLTLSLEETLVFYVGIFIALLFVTRKWNGCMLGVFVCLLIFSSSKAIEKFHLEHQNQVVVFKCNQFSAINLIYGKKHVFIADSSLIQTESLLNYSISPYWRTNRLLEPKKIHLHDLNALTHKDKSISIKVDGFIEFDGKRILIISDPSHLEYQKSDPKIPLDLLIVSNRSKINLTELLETFQIQKIVLDGSISFMNTQEVELLCKKFNIPLHSLQKEGAFVWNLN